jgi:hypothetical protein
MKVLKNAATLGFVALALVSFTGCGGFSASQGVSPATFLLPGLVGTEPMKPQDSVAPRPAVDAETSVQVALAR